MTEPILYTELSEPKHRVLRSDAAFYAVMLLGAIGCIALSRYLSAKFGGLRIIFQVALYAALFSAGYCIYRFRMAAFRYTLTENSLLVHQVVGTRAKALYDVPFTSIASVGNSDHLTGAYDGRTFIGKQEDALCIVYRSGEETHKLYLSASDRLRTMLEEKCHAE